MCTGESPAPTHGSEHRVGFGVKGSAQHTGSNTALLLLTHPGRDVPGTKGAGSSL